MIDVQNLTKRFGPLTAIENVSFSVKQGEIVAFLGPNGAGKTTTMRILTGFMPPTDGHVLLAGFDSFESPIEVKKRIGYLPENPPLYLELTVREYLIFVGRLKGISSAGLSQNLRRVLEKTGLEDMSHRLIGHLSRGYRQRVGLAQALLHDPPIVILDEPTIGLDPNQIIEIRGLIKSLAGSHTIILSTHILQEATALCERVIIIHQGHIVAVDTPDQLAARLQDSERLSVTVKNPPPDMIARLQAIQGVQQVFPGSSPTTFLIESPLGHDIRASLAQAVIDQGLELHELKSIALSLEDVFLQLTRQEDVQQPLQALESKSRPSGRA